MHNSMDTNVLHNKRNSSVLNYRQVLYQDKNRKTQQMNKPAINSLVEVTK